MSKRKQAPKPTIETTGDAAETHAPQAWHMQTEAAPLLKAMARATVILGLLEDRMSLLTAAGVGLARGGTDGFAERTRHAYELMREILSERSYTCQINVRRNQQPADVKADTMPHTGPKE